MQNINYVKGPTDLQCGQAVLSMLTGKSVAEIVTLLDNERETTLKEMFFTLDYFGFSYEKTRKEAKTKSDLPKIALLSLETPRCWHWSLYFDGTFYDPEHGVLNDFPEARRKYFWEIKENLC